MTIFYDFEFATIMADSKHTITIKSEDSKCGVGGSGDVGGDFLKIFQQEVAKLKKLFCESVLMTREKLNGKLKEKFLNNLLLQKQER